MHVRPSAGIGIGAVTTRTPVRRQVLVVAAAALAASLALLPLAAVVRAAGPTMTARVLLGGNVRIGSWAAIAVDFVNDGPAVSGELQLTGGSQGRTRYSTPIDLPTGSRKSVTLYAQPSTFRSAFDLVLVNADGAQVAASSLKVINHDALSPLVGVVAERPQGIVPGVTAALATTTGQPAASVVALSVADLPDRVEGWQSLDRLVWQDVSFDKLSSAQLGALRGWVATGGRLVLVGGTSGSGTFAALPDELLPFRPSATVDITTKEMAALVGTLPKGATPLPAVAGTLLQGRVLARSGDLVAAASEPFGRGNVTFLGFDPTTAWLANSSVAGVVWRLAIPVSGVAQQLNPGTLGDDTQIVQALYDLPTLDLPPIELLLAVLIVYTLLIGPLNYLVLKRLDRRELAWVTMPSLVLLFSVGSYGLGQNLHGTDTVVNELSIVRGTAGTDAGRAQLFVGLFSPSRRSFDLDLNGPVLVTSPASDFQQSASQAGLDVVQGETARVRGLEVTVSALRAFRGEMPATAPLIESDLRLDGSTITGTVTNRSGRTLESPAVVIGSTLVRLDTLADGAAARVSVRLQPLAYGPPLSELLFGSLPVDDAVSARSLAVRRAMLDQLTQGAQKIPSISPAGESPYLVAFGSDPVVAVSVGTERPQSVADTLYLIDLPLRVRGGVVLGDPLVGRQVVDSTANWATDDGASLSLGDGTMTVSYQAAPLDGELKPTKLTVAMLGGGGSGDLPAPLPQPLPEAEPGAAGGTSGGTAVAGGSTSGGGASGPGGGVNAPGPDGKFGQGVPTFELFDRAAGRWVAFAQLQMGQSAVIADPGHFVDASGGLLVRFTYADPQHTGQQAYFDFEVKIEGVVQ